MDNITVGQITSVLAGFFILYELVIKGIALLNKRAEEVNTRLNLVEADLRNEIRELKRGKVDSSDHDKLQEEIRLLLKSNFALLEHNITGNHTEQMIKLKDELNSFILNELG